MSVGYQKPLYGSPFDDRATFAKNMFGRDEQLGAAILRDASAQGLIGGASGSDPVDRRGRRQRQSSY